MNLLKSAVSQKLQPKSYGLYFNTKRGHNQQKD